jgi:hypothetical protein
MSALRAMPLAPGLLLCVIVLSATHARSATRPSLFSDVAPRNEPTVTKLEAPAIVRAPLPLSPQTRDALSERMRAIAAAQPGPVTKVVKHAWDEDRGDAIVMERVVVLEKAEKKVEVESVSGYVARVFTTGAIHESKQGGLLDPSVYWGLGHVRAPRYGTMDTTPRLELSLQWRW